MNLCPRSRHTHHACGRSWSQSVLTLFLSSPVTFSARVDLMPAVGDALGDTCHIIGRKKRRGLIEKRRRDRINNSLNELRRLVPAAFEKQGSAKLEKAEILQMTVDHLTMLHAKGFDAFSFDPHKFAMDYHGIGFRECMSEVIRYLGSVEGLDAQDPLRLRTLSHLQCYASQREMALKSSAAVSSWNPSAFTTPMHQFTVPTVPSAPSLTSAQQSVHHLNGQTMTHNDLLVSSSSSASSSNAPWSGHPHNSNNSDHMLMPAGQMSSEHLMPPPPPLFKTSTSPVGSPVSSSASSTASSTCLPHHSYCYTMAPTAAAAQYFPSAAGYPHHPATSSGSGQQSASVKHYRPWGAELAY